jgi:hypothetical protein
MAFASFFVHRNLKVVLRGILLFAFEGLFDSRDSKNSGIGKT